MNNKLKHAFTLIELIIVISIIGILAVAVITVINPVEQQKKARDVVRKGDLAKISTALEQYYADHNSYPGYSGGNLPDTKLDIYLTNGVPVETLSGYRYCYRPITNTNQSYVLCSYSEAGGDNIPGNSSCWVKLGHRTQPDRYCINNPF